MDKITILEIKGKRIEDEKKLKNVLKELRTLEKVKGELNLSIEAEEIMNQLRSVNEGLWDIEDRIREFEKSKNFGPEFIALARSVYFQNDLRAKFKRQLSELLGSDLIEEKSYTEYSAHA